MTCRPLTLCCVCLVGRNDYDVSPTDFYVLSVSPAGGVGLNLIGANRLIMMDCDWVSSIVTEGLVSE